MDSSDERAADLTILKPSLLPRKTLDPGEEYCHIRAI